MNLKKKINEPSKFDGIGIMYASQGKKDLENVLMSDLFHLQVSMCWSQHFIKLIL